METLLLICVGALVGFRAHRRFKRPLYSRLDCALVGGLTTLLLVTVLDMAGSPVPVGSVYFVLVFFELAWERPRFEDRSIATTRIGRVPLAG